MMIVKKLYQMLIVGNPKEILQDGVIGDILQRLTVDGQ